MTLFTTIQAAVPAGVRAHLLNLDEANYGMDQAANGEFPVAILVPPIEHDTTGVGGNILTRIEVNLMVLDKDPAATTMDFKTEEVSVKYIEPCKAIARKLFRAIEQEDYIDWESGGVEERTFTPAFGQFDGHLHGVIVSTIIHIYNTPVCGA